MCSVRSDCDTLDYSLPGSSVHGILQTGTLEWVAISFSRGSSRPRGWTHISCVSCTGRQIPYHQLHLGIPHISYSLWLFSHSVMSNSETPRTAARQASLSFTISRSLLKLISTESVMPSNHLILCHPLLLLPSVFPTMRVFSGELALRIRWPKYWTFSFSISPSNEYSGFISLRIDWFDLLAVQETLKSLLQHHSSKASILRCSAFFIVQLSYPYMTAGKTIALTRRTFVGRVMSLLCNMLSRFVTAFLPRSKYLLISWLQSPSAVIWGPKKIKSVTVSTVFSSLCHEVVCQLYPQ